TYYFELNLSEVEVVALPIRKYKIFGRLPSVYRDLAFVLPEEVNSNKVQSLILASANELLKECELFDVYQGENLEKGKKSMAFSLRFQDSERTLEEKDIEPLIQNIIEAIQKEFKGELRS
ncbi:MAG: phenylalanine--tRNA ligase subunit beta, partial [Negativicutes bacterium]|nr:phenylalanine--tRNA ligase subunit beta [Negativicutes bacterium]